MWLLMAALEHPWQDFLCHNRIFKGHMWKKRQAEEFAFSTSSDITLLKAEAPEECVVDVAQPCVFLAHVFGARKPAQFFAFFCVVLF